jgi:hypothetical protein
MRTLVAENLEIARHLAGAFRAALDPLLTRIESATDKALVGFLRSARRSWMHWYVEMRCFNKTLEQERLAILAEANSIATDVGRQWTAWAERMIGSVLWFGPIGFAVVLALSLTFGFWLGRMIGRKEAG